MSQTTGNIFDEVLSDAKGIEERLLGPTYPYYKNVKTPAQLGMSDKGTIQQMGKDVDGLVQYVELLVSGKSKASATGGPLGNKFFLQTGAKCAAPSGETTDRYVYIDNVPEGNIPFISSGMGVNFSEFKGLIPGAMGNLNALNPFNIMRAFMTGATPDCQEITMTTIDSENRRGTETHYVTLADISAMDPCSFPDRKNPITGASCKETFVGSATTPAVYPTDSLQQLYLAGVGGLGLYVLYKIMQK